MLTTRTSFFLALLVSTVSGCGVRTGLDLYDDGGIPSRPDGGRIDGGRIDAGRDAGSITCSGPEDCDDGLFCNGRETCVGGRCGFGPPPLCDDGIDCTIDQCSEMVGCAVEPDASRCGPGERCDTLVGCVAAGCTTGEECDDGDVCNGIEGCGPGGFCITGSPIACPVDDIDCTVESCDPVFGCTTITEHSLCPAGSLCVIGEGCTSRDCGSDGECSDGDPCNGRERCAGGTCRSGSPLSCDDGNACTLDRCQAGVGCVTTLPRELCTDRIDNDCNGLTDCGDFACASSPACGCVPVAPEEIFCLDGRDDDCDGLFDCADPRCAGTDECGGCMPTAPIEVFCRDGRDDDCNGAFDCEDMACAGSPECVSCVPSAMTEVRCTGGVDEDCNGLTDCADPRCVRQPVCMSSCVPTAELELGVEACTNGVDDDCDRRPDCADPDCRPLGADGECCNGIDDTGDGNVDELTCYCEAAEDCFGVGSFEQVCWLSTYSICAPDCRRYGGSTWCRMFFPELGMCNRATGECVVP